MPCSNNIQQMIVALCSRHYQSREYMVGMARPHNLRVTSVVVHSIVFLSTTILMMLDGVDNDGIAIDFHWELARVCFYYVCFQQISLRQRRVPVRRPCHCQHLQPTRHVSLRSVEIADVRKLMAIQLLAVGLLKFLLQWDTLEFEVPASVVGLSVPH